MKEKIRNGKLWKRITSLVLALLMIVTLIPVGNLQTAQAATSRTIYLNVENSVGAFAMYGTIGEFFTEKKEIDWADTFYQGDTIVFKTSYGEPAKTPQKKWVLWTGLEKNTYDLSNKSVMKSLYNTGKSYKTTKTGSTVKMAYDDSTLYLYYEAKCKVTYDLDGGNCDTRETIVDRGNSVTLPTPTKTGYVFDGWYTSASGGSMKSGKYTPTEPQTTLYAHWKHEHSWKYETDPSNPSVIKAYCTKTESDCDYSAENVNDAKLSFTLNAQESVYNEQKYNGIKITDSLTKVTGTAAGNVTYYQTDKKDAVSGGTKLESAPTDVGYYYAEVTVGDATAKSAFEIKKADAKADITPASGLVYDGTEQKLITATVKGGTVHYRVGEDGEWTTEIPTAVSADKAPYTVYYYVEGDANHNDLGSADKPESVSVTIAKKTFPEEDIKIAKDQDIVTYDKKPHTIDEITLSGEAEGATITYATEKDGEYSAKKPEFTNVKTSGENHTYTVYYKVSKPEYADEIRSATITIEPKPVSVTWSKTDTLIYNGKEQKPEATAGELLKGDTCEITVEGAQKNYSDTPYTATATGVSNPNYRLPEDASVTTTFTIAKKKIGISWPETEFIYDGTAKLPTATATGLAEGDTCEIEVSGAATDAGTYTAKAEKVSNSNYKLPETVETTYVISKAAPEYTEVPEVKANLVYDGTEQALITAGTTADGILMYKVGDGEWSTEIPAGLNAGDYTVSYKVIGDANHNDSAEGTLNITIAKAKVTVTANNAEKHVNKADPKLYDTIDGIVGMEQLKGISLKREAGEAVGRYAINVTVDSDVNPNYDITTVSGTFTINDHDWSGEWKTVREATETENGKREKSCAYDGCEQKLYDTIPATETSEEPEKPGEGTLRKETEVAPDAPISEATLDNTKSELIKADGIFSEAEKKTISSGTNARVWLEITKTDLSKITKEDLAIMETAAKKIMGENVNLTYFNADLFKQVEGENKNQIHEPGTMIKVTIQIPEALLNHDKSISREYKILRLHDGKVDVISGTFNAETNEFTFETDKFSTYAIAYGDTQLVTGVSLDTTEKTLTKAGETLQLTATIAPKNATNKNLHWTSSNPNVATVDESGLVTAVSNGTATITATTEDGSYTATCIITVNIPAKQIVNNQDKGKNTGDKNQKNTNKKTSVTSAKSPKTGDTNQMAVWFVIVLAAAVILAAAGRKRHTQK